MAASWEAGGAPPPSCFKEVVSSKLLDSGVSRYEQELKDICLALGIDYDKIPPAADADADDDSDPVRAWHFEIGCTLPLPLSPPALKSLSSSQESPLSAAPPQDRAQDSPTSVALFVDFEPFETTLSGLSNSVQPDTSTTHSAYGTSTTSLFSARTTLYSTHKIPTTTCGVSSAYEKESDSLCIPYVQDFPSSSIPIAINGPDPPNFLIAPSFFSYWFDGFMPSQCLCALIILTILSDVPFDDVIPKVRLSKYLK